MKIVTLFYVFLISFATLFGSKDLKQANKAYKKANYIEAINSFEKHLQENEDVDMATRSKMASCYYILNDFESALKQYSVIGEANLKSEDLQTYGELLFLQGDYAKAKAIYSKPEIASKTNSVRMLENLRWLDEKKGDSSMVDVKKTGIKTFGQSFGSQYYKGGIIYSSSSNGQEIVDYRKAAKEDLKVDQKGYSFLNLFYSPLLKDGAIGQAVLFSETLVFDYHVGAVAFSPNYEDMYFTKVLKLTNKKDVLQIFGAKYSGGTWGQQRVMSFNGEDFSCAHPALSMTGDTLYFVSDKVGGKGGKDIWYVTKIGEKWTEPINMGATINTVNDELFPFVDHENTLYFASNGHPGYGGLDVFKITLEDENPVVENMGYGINTPYDDFAYVINPENTDDRLLSSNRGTKGKGDNIYKVTEPKIRVVEEQVTLVEPDSLANTVEFVSTVRNGLSGDPIPNANVRIEFVDQNRILLDAVTNSEGVFSSNLNTENVDEEEPLHIMVVVENEGFEPFSKMISAGEFFASKSVFEEINLMPVLKNEQIVTIPQDKLRFALNSDVLSYGAKSLLERWAEWLETHPTMRIRLNAHTDSQGNLDYNLRLSQSRADNAKMYLMQRGIAEDRIIARGYGERYIINHCIDGVDCSDEEHEVNRRIEIIVVED